MWESWGEGEKRTCGVPGVPPAEVLDAHLSSASIFTIASGGKLRINTSSLPARPSAHPEASQSVHQFRGAPNPPNHQITKLLTQ